MTARAGTVALALLFALMVGPGLVRGTGGTSEAHDQDTAHAPLIDRIAETWPRIEDPSGVAMWPGYHWMLAAVRRAGADRLTVRAVSALFSVALLLVVFRTACRWTAPGLAFALTLPLLASPYFLGGAIWLTTDNAGLLFVAIALSEVLRGPGRTPRAGIVAAALLVVVLVRQVHAWVVVPVLWALVDTGSARRAAGVVAPAALAGLVLVVQWGGLVPAEFAGRHAGTRPGAGVLVALALAGVYGGFFRRAGASPAGAGSPPAVLAAAVAGLLLAALMPSSYDFGAGRWGGPLWDSVRRVGAVGERGVLFLVLVPLGAALLVRAVDAARARPREAVVLAIAFGTWAATQALNMQAFQRYSEPPVLILLAWLTALSVPREGAGSGRRSAPVVLAAGLLVLTALTLYRPLLGTG